MTKETKADMLKRRKQGRPREYDPDLIAEELLQWAKEEESINFTQFCADRGYLPSLIWRLEQEHEDFAYAYTIAKMKLAERRERFLNSNLLNYGAYQRYQSGYDPFLTKSEDSEKDKDAARKKGLLESEQVNLVTLARMAAEGQISQKS